MKKIEMKNPIVEMDGDEMTRILWKEIKKEVIEPFVELRTEYYDLGLQNREATKDRVTEEAALATIKHKVAVKCATITPNKQRMQEYGLSELWKSPNATIRAMLDGTVFRTPIMVDGILPAISSFREPITIARHAYGDIYKSVEIQGGEGGKCELIFTGKSGKEIRVDVADFDEPCIFMGMHNKESSIRSFAKAVFEYALSEAKDVWFGAKDTISKTYDGRFKEIMEEEFSHYKQEFENKGIEYHYTLIDDMAARVVRSKGGFIWACKNYDGDVMSDLLSSAYGSLAMMTSVLVSPDGAYEYEAAHGTIPRHYHKYLKGEMTSTNPMATIFAWSGALKKRGEIDDIKELEEFGGLLERASLLTVEKGTVTGDLFPLLSPDKRAKAHAVDFRDFLEEIKKNLEELLREA